MSMINVVLGLPRTREPGVEACIKLFHSPDSWPRLNSRYLIRKASALPFSQFAVVNQPLTPRTYVFPIIRYLPTSSQRRNHSFVEFMC